MTLHSPLPPWPTPRFVAAMFVLYVAVVCASLGASMLAIALATLAACS